MTARKLSPARAPILTLVPKQADEQTVKALAQLLHLAVEGQVVGLAFCAAMRERRYFVDTAGMAHDNPTFARGMVGALDDHLADLIGGRA